METTPEINTNLEQMTQLCCNALKANETLDAARVDALALNLSTNGWKRHTEDAPPLSSILKDRIKKECREPAMHRGAALDGLVSQVQEAYDKASRMKSSSPNDNRHAESMPPNSTA